MSILISPSLLSANLVNLEREVKEIENAGADWHHVDVMDGHYVPNLTFGIPVVAALKKISKIPLDVHLMVSNPDSVIEAYCDAGADWLSFHIEASIHPHRIISAIQKRGIKAGIALNPGTGIDVILPLLHDCDFLLLMSVNPGFSGQTFIPTVLDKISAAKERLRSIGREDQVLIQVDGGVSTANIEALSKRGAGCFVAGSFIFGHSDRARQIQLLRNSVK